MQKYAIILKLGDRLHCSTSKIKVVFPRSKMAEKSEKQHSIIRFPSCIWSYNTQL